MAKLVTRKEIGTLLLSILVDHVHGAAVSENIYLAKRAPAISTNITQGWSSLGCYTDDVNSRSLYSAATNSATLTENSCIAYCSQNGYTYAGVEYGTECYCGKIIAASGRKADAGDCNMACGGASNELCGAGSRLNIFHLDSDVIPASGPAHNAGPREWGYLGCYVDAVNKRTLPVGGQSAGGGGALTNALCTQACQKQGYTYAGTEYSGECYCGSSLADSYLAPDGLKGCNMVCNGNSSEFCGGPNRLDVFGYHMRSTIAPKWAPVGCVTDAVGSRTFKNGVDVLGGYTNMTLENCQNACYSARYQLAGIEYGQECFCDNDYQNGGGIAPDGDKGCNMACKGDASELCGGPNRMNVYTYVGGTSTTTTATLAAVATTVASSTSAAASASGTPGWNTVGCVIDNVNSRTFRNVVNVAGGWTNLTIENCQAACFAANYPIAGVEYGQECYCDTSLQNGAGLAPDGNAGCNMACKGNANEVCGGPDRLNVFRYVVAPVSTTSANATSAVVVVTTAIVTTTPDVVMTTAAITTTVSATPTPNRGKYTYAGCYIDNANGGRILTQQQANDPVTIGSCIAICAAQNLTIAGMEYSTQCFCGNSMVNGAALAKQDSDCAMTCQGNANEICGGPDRMSIYSIGNFTVYAPPKAANASLPGNWTYRGCLADTPQPRVLPYQIDMNNDLSIAKCLNLCAKYGYSAASMEYGQQCFCGDDYNRIQTGAQFLTGGQCNTPCPAQPEALCGGANAMNYYTWDNMYTWANASGDAAGAYQFLIGGVVIPLITTVGVNNKVTFVEKHGTGPANSTGAFELDVSLSNDFSSAWRTMHGLRTDVFCSAGLTLPDKGGRQINIGGWSADSLFGIRFYLPDGSPGVASTNDWEESVADVHLQVGRWYPSAMQMANGSILVVGGEDGSNGAPVPNLEVIPTPPGGPVVFMQWLKDTDPNNLYPFLAVLPTGNIVVIYYNQARIIDEQTFATVRTLPTIPGAVNNDGAGRTYPMAGTMMILPQSAPFTDPLGVLICGGSTPYAGVALDNCVTLSPEVQNSNWTIERMPSKRVMTCMTALPDGTYLILNGAKQGLAGFGLASDPNHEAVLYDPSKPLNQRMTRMATTIVDRLYHSEAILLPDGRVLVSGSDPEDKIHEQEYRVEVFIPPYLMGNKAVSRPTVTVPNNDWAYGQSYQIQVTGSISKISLMGAVSSTHGNSMGQRTLFPSFSCYGNTCNVTAPPNRYVTGGPNWFMLFALNAAGTPSVAQWVRIGGDPAGLGNWPDTGDFTLPGV